MHSTHTHTHIRDARTPREHTHCAHTTVCIRAEDTKRHGEQARTHMTAKGTFCCNTLSTMPSTTRHPTRGRWRSLPLPSIWDPCDGPDRGSPSDSSPSSTNTSNTSAQHLQHHQHPDRSSACEYTFHDRQCDMRLAKRYVECQSV